MLTKIKETLETLDPHVCYGTDRELDGVNVWDYMVFRRVRTNVVTRQKGDTSTYYEIHIIRQDYVPEGEPEKVMAALAQIPGLKPSGEDITYTMVLKSGTKAQLEIATLTMVEARKRGGANGRME